MMKIKPKAPPPKIIFIEGENPSFISRIINKLNKK